MPSKTKKTFDYILKSIPYITGLLIFFGILRLYIFYQFFDLNILSYLSINECLTATLDFFLVGIFTCPFSFLFMGHLLKQPAPAQEIKVNKFLKKYIGIDDFGHRQGFIFNGILVPILILNCLICILIYIFFKSSVWAWFIFISFLTLNLFFILISIGDLEYKRMAKLQIEPIFPQAAYVFIAIFFFLSLFLIFMSSLMALNLKEGKDNIKFTKITYKDNKTYTTSDTVIYVGHLQNYTILYNKPNHSAKIISNDQIMEVEELPAQIKK